jgi:hypothetical protein
MNNSDVGIGIYATEEQVAAHLLAHIQQLENSIAANNLLPPEMRCSAARIAELKRVLPQLRQAHRYLVNKKTE